MRILRFLAEDGSSHVALRQGQEVLDITLAVERILDEEVSSPRQFMVAGLDGLIGLRDLADRVNRDPHLARSLTRPLADVRLDAPIRDAPKLLALAGNYRRHVVESGFPDVEDPNRVTPQVFLKPVSTTINAPNSSVCIRANNFFVDWEIELAVVIGPGGKAIEPEQAMSHVFGYSIINDVSERSFNSQLSNRIVREADSFFDWLMGKWFDGFAPLGPEIVTRDEVKDPHNLRIQLWVNDVLMQDANTSEMLFRIPQAISYISQVLTLEPGDIIAMGTPHGVGKARGIRLKPGDRMKGEIEGIGTLETSVTEAEVEK